MISSGKYIFTLPSIQEKLLSHQLNPMPPSTEPDASQASLDLGHSQGVGGKDHRIIPPSVMTAIDEDSSKTGAWLIVFGTWVGIILFKCLRSTITSQLASTVLYIWVRVTLLSCVYRNCSEESEIHLCFSYVSAFGVYQDHYTREILPNKTPSEIR